MKCINYMHFATRSARFQEMCMCAMLVGGCMCEKYLWESLWHRLHQPEGYGRKHTGNKRNYVQGWIEIFLTSFFLLLASCFRSDQQWLGKCLENFDDCRKVTVIRSGSFWIFPWRHFNDPLYWRRKISSKLLNNINRVSSEISLKSERTNLCHFWSTSHFSLSQYWLNMVAVVNSQTVDSAELYSVRQTSTLPPNLASSQHYCISTLPSNFRLRHQQLKWVANCFRMINVRFFFTLHSCNLDNRTAAYLEASNVVRENVPHVRQFIIVAEKHRSKTNTEDSEKFPTKTFSPKRSALVYQEKKATGKWDKKQFWLLLVYSGRHKIPVHL